MSSFQPSGNVTAIFIVLLGLLLYAQPQIENRRPPAKRPPNSHMEFYIILQKNDTVWLKNPFEMYRNLPSDYYQVCLRINGFPQNYNYSIWMADSIQKDSVMVMANRSDTVLVFPFEPPSGFPSDKSAFFYIVPNGYGPRTYWSHSGALKFTYSSLPSFKFNVYNYFIELFGWFVFTFLGLMFFIAVQWRSKLRHISWRKRVCDEASGKILQSIKLVIPFIILYYAGKLVYASLYIGIYITLENILQYVVVIVLPVIVPFLLVYIYVRMKEFKHNINNNAADTIEALLLQMSEYDHGGKKRMILLKFRSLMLNFETLCVDYSDAPEKLSSEVIANALQVQFEVLPSLQRIVNHLHQLSQTEGFDSLGLESKIADFQSMLAVVGDLVPIIIENVRNEQEFFSNTGTRQICSSVVEPIEKMQRGYELIRTEVLQNTKVLIAPVIEYITQKYNAEELLQKAEIQFTTQILGEPDVYCMFGRIDLIDTLTNIINNAVEELSSCDEREKLLRLSVNTNDHEVIIAISDSGRGIPMELNAQIFKKGFSTKGKGRGHGLYLALRNVRKYHGKLELLSNQPCGVKFVLIIKRV